MSDALLLTVADRVATLSLNRPDERNPLSPELAAALVAQLRRLDADDAVKVILIRAEGKNFSAGGDIKNFQKMLELEPAERYELFAGRLAVGNRLPQALVQSRKPIVTASRGAVAGAGIALCLAADIAVAGESCFFLAAHVLLGLSLDCGLSALLAANVGLKQAKRIALLGERVPAGEALALGMVSEVVPDEQVDARALQIALRLAAGPATAIEGSRRLLHDAVLAGLDAQLAREARWLATCAASEDFRIGVQNFTRGEHRPFL